MKPVSVHGIWKSVGTRYSNFGSLLRCWVSFSNCIHWHLIGYHRLVYESNSRGSLTLFYCIFFLISYWSCNNFCLSLIFLRVTPIRLLFYHEFPGRPNVQNNESGNIPDEDTDEDGYTSPPLDPDESRVDVPSGGRTYHTSVRHYDPVAVSPQRPRCRGDDHPVLCKDGSRYICSAQNCDGVLDCQDGADEEGCISSGRKRRPVRRLIRFYGIVARTKSSYRKSPMDELNNLFR